MPNWSTMAAWSAWHWEKLNVAFAVSVAPHLQLFSATDTSYCALSVRV